MGPSPRSTRSSFRHESRRGGRRFASSVANVYSLASWPARRGAAAAGNSQQRDPVALHRPRASRANSRTLSRTHQTASGVSGAGGSGERHRESDCNCNFRRTHSWLQHSSGRGGGATSPLRSMLRRRTLRTRAAQMRNAMISTRVPAIPAKVYSASATVSRQTFAGQELKP